MTDSKLNGLLGLARRAGKVSLGHDAALTAVKQHSAHLCLVASDASERLHTEFARAVQAFGGDIPLLKSDYTMAEFGQVLGTKTTAVLTVDDRGFAQRISELIGRE
ncbi:MAG: L7Ae/L30e/S12e/Gadd45 family ribosomal protein [Candidatus Fimenecus sp.]